MRFTAAGVTPWGVPSLSPFFFRDVPLVDVLDDILERRPFHKQLLSFAPELVRKIRKSFSGCHDRACFVSLRLDAALCAAISASRHSRSHPMVVLCSTRAGGFRFIVAVSQA